jgi:GT2 family glycosyltransferase
MDVSVIIVNYNTCQLTLKSIESVFKFAESLRFEVILVDNNSSDDSVASVQEKFPKVKVIQNKKNFGFGVANNIAAKVAKGEFLFLLNSDAYLIGNSMLDFLMFMRDKMNANVFACGGQLIYENGVPNISIGHFPSFKNFVEGSIWRHFYSKKFFANHDVQLPYDTLKAIPVDYVSGANYFVRTNVFREAGGFNKRFFMYFEETELSFRVQKENPSSQIYFLPKIKIVHLGQGSNLNSKKSIRFKLMYLRSRALYFRYQNGKKAFVMVYLRGLITIFFKR